MRAEGARLPDFFAVYPEWMKGHALGEALFERTVTDATILGGHTMRVYRARYDTLGTGEAPWSSGGRIIIASTSPTSRARPRTATRCSTRARPIKSSKRRPRLLESSWPTAAAAGARATGSRPTSPPGSQLRAVARLRADYGARLVARVDGSPVAELDVPDGEWTEVSFPVRVKSEGGATTVDLEARGTARFASFHYFFVDEGGGPDAR